MSGLPRRLAPALATCLLASLAAAPAWAQTAAATVPPVAAVVADAKIDSGDTAWMLTSTALVLMMTIPGLALFYAGMVRKKNILATMMQSFIICCLVTVTWMVAGYSLAFTNGEPLHRRPQPLLPERHRRELGQAVHARPGLATTPSRRPSPRRST